MTENIGEGQLVPSDPGGDYLDLAALFANTVPVLGGVVSNVLSGWSLERRMRRVNEVLKGLAGRLDDLRVRVNEQYIRSDEFEELLDQTLRRVAQERHEEKRRLYREFLLGALSDRQDSYDEQLRILRILDQLQVTHIKIIAAMLVKPSQATLTGGIGSFGQTLKRRLPELSEERIEDLVSQLRDHRIVNLGSLKTAMTAHGAEDMTHGLTPFGQRFVRYIQGAAG